MKLLKNDFQKLAAAFALGALSIGFAPVAAAVSTYDASASLDITLTDVKDLRGIQQTDFWSVTALGGGDVFLTETGVATASGTTIVIDPEVSMGIGTTVSQSSTSSGIAFNGTATTDALTDLAVTITSTSDLILNFYFDFDVTLNAATMGDAGATAQVDLLDDLGFVDVQAFADALSFPGEIDTGNGLVTLHGSAIVTLDPFGTNTISGFVDSWGYATAVPVPAAVWLFGTGLIGLIGVARRKQAA